MVNMALLRERAAFLRKYEEEIDTKSS